MQSFYYADYTFDQNKRKPRATMIPLNGLDLQLFFFFWLSQSLLCINQKFCVFMHMLCGKKKDGRRKARPTKKQEDVFEFVTCKLLAIKKEFCISRHKNFPDIFLMGNFM